MIAQRVAPNLSTSVAYNAITYAIASNGGKPVDIIAYSGGAGAFAAAYKLLTPAQKSMIGNILYVTPGSAGAALPSGSGQTTVEWGTGAANHLANLFTSAPPGSSVVSTDCKHTALGCFFGDASSAISQIEADGQCSYPEVYTRDRPEGWPGVGVPDVLMAPTHTGSSWGQPRVFSGSYWGPPGSYIGGGGGGGDDDDDDGDDGLIDL